MKIKLFIALFLSLIFVNVSEAAFLFSRTVTIDHTKVPNTDQTDFPVLISGTYSYLATVSNGGKVQNSNGYDVGFYTNSNCFTGKMDWETEVYTGASGVVQYWVKVSSLSHLTDNVFYICYGDASITTDQSAATNVWDSAFKGVWHFANGTVLAVTDSTSNANTMTNVSATATTGKIDGGVAMSGSSQYLTRASTASLAGIIGDLTISAWINPTDRSNYFGIVSKTASNLPASFDVYLNTGDGIPVFYRGNGAGSNANRNGTTAPSTGVWTLLTIKQSSTTVTHYLNGAVINSGSLSATQADTGANFRIGSRNDSVTMFKGSMDEVRISNIARSSDWIATEYNNQNSPSTFYALGNEVSNTRIVSFGNGTFNNIVVQPQ